MQDYPAAHSMDTQWFAVDASGNLAIFDSGEGGAVPETNRRILQTVRIDDLESLFHEMAKNHENRLIKLNIPGDIVNSVFLNEQDHRDVLFDRQNFGSRKDAHIYIEKSIILPLEKPKNKSLICNSWLLLLAGDDVIARLKIEERDYNYAVRFFGESTIVFVRECNFKLLQDLFKKGYILAGKALNSYRNGFARLLGFFVYWQDSQVPLPYSCIGKPIAPLILEDLPEYLQDIISWNWFDRLQFNETQIIQPIEYMPCSTWNSGWWLDTQGQEHDRHPDSYPC